MANVKLYTFSGTHHEVGVQQGQVGRQQIREGLEKIPDYEFLRLMKPRWLPMSLFIILAKRRAERLLKNDVFEYYPKQAQRLSGIAEGAETSLSTSFSCKDWSY